jgi:hypothetical protein
VKVTTQSVPLTVVIDAVVASPTAELHDAFEIVPAAALAAGVETPETTLRPKIAKVATSRVAKRARKRARRNSLGGIGGESY